MLVASASWSRVTPKNRARWLVLVIGVRGPRARRWRDTSVASCTLPPGIGARSSRPSVYVDVCGDVSAHRPSSSVWWPWPWPRCTPRRGVARGTRAGARRAAASARAGSSGILHTVTTTTTVTVTVTVEGVEDARLRRHRPS